MNIDPVLSYKVVAHTIPQTEAEGDWKLIPGKHTTIPIKCPQGTLSISSAINKTKVDVLSEKKAKLKPLTFNNLIQNKGI